MILMLIILIYKILQDLTEFDSQQKLECIGSKPDKKWIFILFIKMK